MCSIPVGGVDGGRDAAAEAFGHRPDRVAHRHLPTKNSGARQLNRPSSDCEVSASSNSGRCVCDNMAADKTPAIRDWLARHPRFHLHFTPTGSSWINQVERWFGLLTDQLIRRGVHQSVVALENDVRQWIKNWNQDPKPFVWTKTAEDILQSLSKYIAKISDAGH